MIGKIFPLTARIAARYLFGRKSHSAVNAIALVSLCGIAVATAAIVCVLSVFNGFRDVLGGKLDNLTPDVEVSLKTGKVFGDCDALAKRIGALPEVAMAQPVLADQALALFGTRELPVILRGVVPATYTRATRIDTLFFDGSEPLEPARAAADPAPASLAIGTAVQLQVNGLGQRIMIFAPRRQGRINLANPAASFETDSVEVTSIYRSGQKELDENVIITDIGRVRELLQHGPGYATAIEVSLKPGVSSDRGAAAVAAAVGPEYKVKDRFAQHEVNYRMVQIEKYITFLLLVFILIIASFNVVSTLCMLVIEKEDSIRTLDALGLSRRRIGNVFAWESWLVTLSGGAAGIVVGSILCLLQQHFGLIKLNGEADTLIMASYPVSLEWGDLGLTMLPILVIGFCCAMTASGYARRKLR